MAECTVRLSRGDSTPWGFRLGGGKDFGYPLSVQRVNPGSLAEQGGMRTGDVIAKINGKPTANMLHADAQNTIVVAGNNLDIVVQRGTNTTWAPLVSSVGEITPGGWGPVTQTSLAANKQPFTPVGSGHNQAPKPFGGAPASPLVNKQYNCPAALYSMENIQDAIDKQSQVLQSGAVGINFMKEEKPLNTNSAVYRMVHEEDQSPRPRNASPAVRPHSGVDCAPAFGQAGLRHVEAPKPSAVADQPTPPVAPGGANICSECGKLIVGVFCRIKDRNMHAECFRCATCGNSLKNVGYYLVGGRLYCDIHARNASLMLKEPVSPSSQPGAVAPLPSVIPTPSCPFNVAPVSPKPYGGPTQAPFRSVPPPVPPKPAQRNSGCFPECAAGPVPAPPMPVMAPVPPAPAPAVPSASAPTWPPQQPQSQCQQQQSFQQTSSVTTSFSSGLNAGAGSMPAPKRGRGILNQAGDRIPVCSTCSNAIRGPFITAMGQSWCPNHFICATSNCRRDLMDCGFVEERGQVYCENCYENYMAPVCNKCNQRIKGDCLNAIGKSWHPQCFMCTHCKRPFGNNSFYLEDGLPYCENDWNELFTSKCFGCGFPIEAGDRWVEALNNNYHFTCFKCTVCHQPLEGQSFYAKAGKPYCRLHAR